MKFEDPAGWSFSLNVVGYEFPELETDPYDSNWLLIHIDVNHPLGQWSATDPALLAYEVESLAKWLELLVSGDFSRPNEWFTEPCLEFRLSLDEHPEPILQVLFSHEFRPPWASRELHEDEKEHCLAFRLADLNLRHSVQSLRDQLKRFPQRAER